VTIHFPDLSHYPDANPAASGTQTLDLHDVVALVTKATEGTSYVDPTYAIYRDRAKARGIPFAAYHWIHATDIPGQARHAFSVVGPSVPLMIDDEDTTDGLSVSRTLAFVAAYRALGGTVTLEYLPHWFWQQNGSPDLRPLAKAGLALISSNYTTYSDSGPGWAPYGGVTPTIWQYTSSAKLDGAAKVDMNAFKGSIEQLRAIFTGAASTVEDDMATICTYGDQGAAVTAMQKQLLALNPKALPKYGPDGGYGDETATALKTALGAGDGHTYTTGDRALLLALQLAQTTATPPNVDVDAIAAKAAGLVKPPQHSHAEGTTGPAIWA
jgi:GH25 family lysozyme M1 (1,4-beta-N-acetylmuramidase)